MLELLSLNGPAALPRLLGRRCEDSFACLLIQASSSAPSALHLICFSDSAVLAEDHRSTDTACCSRTAARSVPALSSAQLQQLQVPCDLV